MIIVLTGFETFFTCGNFFIPGFVLLAFNEDVPGQESHLSSNLNGLACRHGHGLAEMPEFKCLLKKGRRDKCLH